MQFNSNYYYKNITLSRRHYATEPTSTIDTSKPRTSASPNTTTTSPNWYMMEKFDGVRVYWDGKGSLQTQNTKPISVPASVTKDFPSYQFEGELWCGTNSFPKAVALTTGKADPAEWQTAKIMVFDAPLDSENVYKDRLDSLQKHIKDDHPMLKLVKNINCFGQDHIQECLKEIVSRGGEGVVLRKASAYYFEKNAFFKKKENPEYEAKVVKFDAQKGLLVCKHPNGRQFYCDLRGAPAPAEGSVVTIKCQREVFGTKSPQRAFLFKVRPELNWVDISKEFFKYHLATAKTSRSSCSGCRKRFEKGQPAITTEKIENAKENSRIVNVYFCSSACVDLGYKRLQGSVAPWDRHAWVDAKFKEIIPKANFTDVSWVME